MSIDRLQEKIRKTKNPSVIALNLSSAMIPPYMLEEEPSWVDTYGKYGREVLSALKGIVPAVRFSYSWYAIMGGDGLSLLQYLLQDAHKNGFYVILDAPQALSPEEAEWGAAALLEYPCDGIVVSSYIGSDGLKPYVNKLKQSSKSLFAVIRTANKTAPELQDLMTGSRLVHMAAADVVNRLGEPLVGKCGFSQVAAVAAASSAESLRSLRGKYKYLFLLLDGYDYPNANAKNCSYAFDRLGHGAMACAGNSVVAAWTAQETDGREFAACAVHAAERMKKNLTRYITIF